MVHLVTEDPMLPEWPQLTSQRTKLAARRPSMLRRPSPAARQARMAPRLPSPAPPRGGWPPSSTESRGIPRPMAPSVTLQAADLKRRRALERQAWLKDRQNVLFRRGHIRMAQAVSLTVVLCLRPSDTLFIPYANIFPPAAGDLYCKAPWSLTLHALEDRVPSQTWESDKLLTVDNHVLHGCAAMLNSITQNRHDRTRVLVFTLTV